tara:strand:- start:843 stop:3419 length:2577 start_codon:yes stop_codon:yes gene_type:complete
MTSFELNGKKVNVKGQHAHLLGALRDELGVLSPKDGCSPSGQCGCCTVIMDGKARISCQLSPERADGAVIQTLEGLDAAEVDRMGKVFAACGALQCGFCTPGIMIRTKVLVDKKGPELEREYAARHLGAHLCRCTGYIKILDAVESLARSEIPEIDQNEGIGSSLIKYEAHDLAEGKRPFIDDLEVEGILHGAFKLADYARADIISIDTSKAEAFEGVERVITAADVPGELKVGLIHKDWPVFIPVGGRTSYLGDVIAMVVADTRETARAAAELIEIAYNELPVITNPIKAMDSKENAVWGLEGNILSTSTYKRGEPQDTWEGCSHIITETFQTQRVDHAFLEPESTLATFDENGKLYVYSGGQGIWDDRNDIARVLGIEQSDLTVELVSNGGAFGGKEDMSNQAQTALAAWLLEKPVKTTLSREESFLIHTKRHPIRLQYKVGCNDKGELKALTVKMVGDSGPYASVGMKVLERAAGHACGPYVIPNIEVEAVAVRTNNSVCGAFRGFGANQAQFAMEGVMDRLAEKVGISGWEIRDRNVITSGSIWGPGQIMDDGSLGAKACLDAVKPEYDAAVSAGKPVGVGLGLKNSGLGNGFKEIARAVVRFSESGRVQVRHCWTEMGQGVHTVALQVAAEELGVPAADIDVLVDTSHELGAGQTTGSRGTLMGAGAVQDACRNAIDGGRQVGVDYYGEYRVDWTNSLAENIPNPVIHSTFGYAAQLVIMDPGSGKIEKVVAAHDVGKAVNPLLCEGQIEGAVHMGLGYALTEGFPCDELGKPKNLTLKSLNIIRPKDMPDVDVILVESPEPNSPYGIKGVGEIGLVPTAGAVAAALKALDGVWRNELPMEDISNREREDAWN